MKTMYFNVDDFPKLCKEFHAQGYTNWITFLYDLGYTFKWQHYARKSERVEMPEDEFSLFLLKWGS